MLSSLDYQSVTSFNRKCGANRRSTRACWFMRQCIHFCTIVPARHSVFLPLRTSDTWDQWLRDTVKKKKEEEEKKFNWASY